VRLAVAALGATLAACGTPMPSWLPDAGPCVPYVSTADLTSPQVAFKTDVMPVFEKSCASASCHGIADSPKGDLFLGAQLAKGSDATTVHANLVGKTSTQLPTMAFVVAGDASHSYLMHKLDGDQCMYEPGCLGRDCQKSMPFDGGLLDVAARDTVRRWIAQGAPDN
jgi:hypothetical protein